MISEHCSSCRAMAGALLGWLLLLTAGSSVCAAPILHVVYPLVAERPSDGYGYRVLNLALEKSGRPYTLSISATKMNVQRARQSIDDGSISVIDIGTGAELEDRFATVYFPIDRGLSGYRLLIINKNQRADFAAIKTLADLQKKVAGQGTGWADIKILESAHIKVELGDFTALFRMVDRNRFDFFPLGIDEVFSLLDKYRSSCPDSLVEPSLVLHYPFARLFFVKKDNLALRDAIMAGLEKAFADGSFQKLMDLDPAYKEALARAQLNTRTMIDIDNPSLTPEFRRIPAKYFVRP